MLIAGWSFPWRLVCASVPNPIPSGLRGQSRSAARRASARGPQIYGAAPSLTRGSLPRRLRPSIRGGAIWDRSPGSRSSNWPGSGRGRCARCCSPIWARRCCASSGRGRAISASSAHCVTTCLLRGRRSVSVDLKSAGGRALALRLVEEADALIEGFRPGVTERLGLGPDDCLARNPASSTAGSPAGVRTGRWRRPPGTTSTTSRSPARCTRSAAAASRRPRH